MNACEPKRGQSMPGTCSQGSQKFISANYKHILVEILRTINSSHQQQTKQGSESPMAIAKFRSRFHITVISIQIPNTTC